MKLSEEAQREESRSLYDQALSAYVVRDFAAADRYLQALQALTGGRSLPSLLLSAYLARDRGQPLSEIRLLQQAIELYEGDAHVPLRLLATAWSLLGAALSYLGESAMASAAFRKAARLEPNRDQKLVECSNAIFTANAVEGLTAEEMQGLYREYRGLLADVSPWPRRWYDHRRLRIGYLSGDFGLHPVAYFAYALLRYFQPEIFQVYCYAVNQHEDLLTERLKRLPVIWRDTRTKDWEEAAAAVRADEIDILVDLSGHTAGNCLPVFAYQPAAVQLSGIGYMNSTGLSNVDGFLSDVYCAPKAADPFFTEPLLRLPQTHLCYTRPHAFPEVVDKPPSKRSGYVTFGCFNNFSKVTDGMLSLWQKILERTPGARLLLKHKIFDSEEGRAYADGRLRQAGLDRSRVEYRGFSADYLAEYNDIDVALDTAPYTGGLTTCEALYMGVPVVSLTGRRHGARFGYSLLHNVGVGDLAAATPEAYVETAAALAAAPETLTGLRRVLRPMMARSPLMDGRGYARAVEEMYQRVYAACRGRAEGKRRGRRG